MEEDQEKKAVAITQGEDGKPRIVAVGRGKLAERMIEIARESQVEVRQDSELLEQILNLEARQSVPRKIFDLIEEIISFVSRLNEAWLRKDIIGEGGNEKHHNPVE